MTEEPDLRATLLKILRRYGIREQFSPEVQAEVEVLQTKPGLDDPALEDRTGQPFITIDNEDSLDLDQAIFIERTKGNGYLVCYALADAAHFVRPGTALFDEALERGVSYYLPELCVPMLPRALSEGIVSLNPEVDRRALVFNMTLDTQGRPLRTVLSRSLIHSRAKLTYDGVQAFYEDPTRSPLSGCDYTETLELLGEVGRARLAIARQRDVVQFNRVDVEVRPSDDGESLVLELEERNDASRYNEQISLLCNMEGARLLAEGGFDPEVQPVFRVHDSPDPQSLHHLEQVVRSVASAHDLDPEVWCWRRRSGEDAPGESLADFLERLPTETTEQSRICRAIERQILITNRRSIFAAKPGRHFALGVSPYSRFSSPMREVVGVFTHKEALEKLGVIAPSTSPAQDDALREQVIQAANRSKERQRRISKEVMGLALDQVLGRELSLPIERRRTFNGTILGIRATRLYVGLTAPPLDLKVYVEDIERHIGQGLELAGEAVLGPAGGEGTSFRLGDPIALRVDRRDGKGRWHLVPVS